MGDVEDKDDVLPDYRLWAQMMRTALEKEYPGNTETRDVFDAFCNEHLLDSFSFASLLHSDMQNTDDEQYAKLIKGAMVNTSMNVVWTPEDEMENSRIDDDNFTSVMWTYLQVHFPIETIHDHLCWWRSSDI